VRQRGFVLVIVIFFAALLFSAIATFSRRATLDSAIVVNRDNGARAEALARGGIQLAVALLLQDRLEEQRLDLPIDSSADLWAQVAAAPIETEDGGRLEIAIEDAGARVNLNALVADGEPISGAEAFLQELLAKVVEEMPGRPEDKLYDEDDLARDLLDFIDADDVTGRGELEDDFYQQQLPPYRAANRPLLTLTELALVRGYDDALITALGPYLTVFPYTEGQGPNPNTAPSWVLASLFVGPETDRRLAPEDDVRRILMERSAGPLCDGVDHAACIPMQEAYSEATLLPHTQHSDVFLIRAEARYGDVGRTIEATIDRSKADAPAILAWSVR
jgi:general secretion pathway protein K